MSNETLGHDIRQGGLRGHSIDRSVFPFTVVVFGDGDYAAYDCRTSNIGTRRRTYQAARIDISGLQVRNLVNS